MVYVSKRGTFVDVYVHHTANPPGLQGFFPKCQNCSVCLQNYTFSDGRWPYRAGRRKGPNIKKEGGKHT